MQALLNFGKDMLRMGQLRMGHFVPIDLMCRFQYSRVWGQNCHGL